MDLTKEIQNNDTVLVIVSKEQYHANLVAILKSVAESMKKICYVCVNDPYTSVKNNLDKNSLNADKFFFIDTLTKKVQEPPKVEDCIFISAPNALTEMSMAFTKSLQEQHCDGTLFDTLSALLIYENPHAIVQFVHNILTKLKVSASKAVFIALKDDVQSELVNDLYMFVDKVADLSEEPTSNT